MLEKMGNRRYLIPFVAIVAIFIVFGTAFYPELHATPQDVPFAIVNLDQGVATPTGQVNMGDAMVQKMQEGGAAASPIAWTTLDSQAALDAAMANDQFYGALVIPEDFSTTQAAAAAGTGNSPSVQVVINQGKNAMLATTMQTAITGILAQAGLTAQVTTINGAEVGGGALGGLMSAMIMVMPPMMMAMISSVLLFLALRPRKQAATTARAKAVGKQLGFAVVVSAAIAGLAVLMATWVGGLSIPARPIFFFIWATIALVMVLFIGALDLALPLGVVVIAGVFALGTTSAMLAREMLPSFWQHWVYPWVPQRFMGDGIRHIIYMNGSALNASLLPLLVTGAIGLVLMALAFVIPARRAGAVQAKPVPATATS